jgi:hypothetical protein
MALQADIQKQGRVILGVGTIIQDQKKAITTVETNIEHQ